MDIKTKTHFLVKNGKLDFIIGIGFYYMETGCIQTLVKKNSLELFKIQENEKNS
jgi:hypothetical protein